MAETEDKLWAELLNGQHAAKRHKVRLTAKCRGVVVGNEVKGAGDVVEMLADQARQLCIDGHAEPIGLGWFTMPAKKPAAPQPEAPERLDRPGNGRRCKVLVLKSVYLGGDRSYGDGETLYLSEADARLLLGAGRIKPLEPAELPPLDEPAKPRVETSCFGASPLVQGPMLQRDVMK